MSDARLTRRALLGGLLAAAAMAPVPAAGRARGNHRGRTRGGLTVLRGETMGTTWTARLAGLPGGVAAADLRAAIEEVLERVNDQMSTWRAGSELSRFNAGAATAWFAVSADTVTVLEEALRVGRLSGGAFDCTVGPLVDAWGFGPPGSERPGPAETWLGGLRAGVGDGALRTRRSPPAIARSRPATCIDLSGIAKGFGVDRVAACLAAAGVERFLVEIGGELLARGTSHRGDAWRAGIERPDGGEPPRVQRIVELSDAAMATSGDARQWSLREGKRCSHLIDPRSGRPVAHGLASVSVVAASAMTADALATAIMVLGPEAGLELARRHGVAALLIERDGAGGFAERWTSGIEPLLGEAAP